MKRYTTQRTTPGLLYSTRTHTHRQMHFIRRTSAPREHIHIHKSHLATPKWPTFKHSTAFAVYTQNIHTELTRKCTLGVGNALSFSSAWRTLHSRDTQVLVANDNTHAPHTETSRHAPTVERRHPHIIYINSPCSATSVLYKRIPDTDDRLTHTHKLNGSHRNAAHMKAGRNCTQSICL